MAARVSVVAFIGAALVVVGVVLWLRRLLVPVWKAQCVIWTLDFRR